MLSDGNWVWLFADEVVWVPDQKSCEHAGEARACTQAVDLRMAATLNQHLR